MNFVGLQSQKLLSENLEVYPNPANDILYLKSKIIKEGEKFNLRITNSIGQILKEEEIEFINKCSQIKIDSLPNGIYMLSLKYGKSVTAARRCVVSR